MKTNLMILSTILLGVTIAARADVAENWNKHCAKCHGADGKGDTKMGKKAGVKDMTTAQYQADLKEDKAVKAVKEGIKEGKVEKMKPNKILSDDEIQQLIAHVRTFKN